MTCIMHTYKYIYYINKLSKLLENPNQKTEKILRKKCK